MVIVIVQHGKVLFSHVTRAKKTVTDRDEKLARAKAEHDSQIERGYYSIELRFNVHGADTSVDETTAIK